MTYNEIFVELYITNKTKIKCYFIISIMLAVFLGISNNEFVWASAGLFDLEQTNKIGGSMATMIISCANVSGFIIEPITIMALEAAYVLLCPFLPEQYVVYVSYTGLMQSEIISIMVVSWFVIAKLLRSFSITRIAGLSIETLENNIGRFALFTIYVSQLLQNPQLGMQAMASNGLVNKGTTILSTVSTILMIFGIFILVLILYTVMRTVTFASNVLLLPFLAIPFSSLCIELIKIFTVIGTLYLAFTRPMVFLIFFLIFFLICLCLFRKAYVLVRYFKAIYLKPLIAKFKGYKKKLPIIYPKISKKLKLYLTDETIKILIPVYVLKKVSDYSFLKKYDKWWFVSTEREQFVCKPQFFKNDFYKIQLHNDENDKIFMNQALRFYEIFNLKLKEENISKKHNHIKKEFYFVYSKEYYFRFEEIKSITGFIDYKIYKKTVADNENMRKRKLKKN